MTEIGIEKQNYTNRSQIQIIFLQIYFTLQKVWEYETNIAISEKPISILCELITIQ